jgi:hypothetical protein
MQNATHTYNPEARNSHNVVVIANRVVKLPNKEAWREINAILRDSGYNGPVLAIMRDKIWEYRQASLRTTPL